MNEWDSRNWNWSWSDEDAIEEYWTNHLSSWDGRIASEDDWLDTVLFIQEIKEV